jgi:hypothetical protein
MRVHEHPTGTRDTPGLRDQTSVQSAFEKDRRGFTISKQKASNATMRRTHLAQALVAALEAMGQDSEEETRSAVRNYEAAVRVLANGDAKVISMAGLLSRDYGRPRAPVGMVAVVHQKPGRHPMEGILDWPAAPGATWYAVEVNYTPEKPAGPWIALVPSAGRRRVVTATTPGGRLLARVASLGSDGTQSDWSDAVLVTTSF